MNNLLKFNCKVNGIIFRAVNTKYALYRMFRRIQAEKICTSTDIIAICYGLISYSIYFKDGTQKHCIYNR